MRARANGRGVWLSALLWVALGGCANVYSHPVKPLSPEYSTPADITTPLAQWVQMAWLERRAQHVSSGGVQSVSPPHTATHRKGTIGTLPANRKATVTTQASNSTQLLTAVVAQAWTHSESAGATDDTTVKSLTGKDSGFYPLANGVEAFAARNALVKSAQRSLDLQYYTLQQGLSTRLLIREIASAADRGVRVRILLDDREQLGRDKEMLMLNAHPNIEVRVFNPIKRFRSNVVSRWTVFLSNLSTLRRRMHIKMWLADGVLGITGGRNLGDRYFNAGQEDNFSDMDVLLGGAVVGQMQAGFDAYWNSAQVMAVDAFDAEHATYRREQISRMILNTNRLTRRERVQRHPYLQALQQTEQSLLQDILTKVQWGEVTFLIDPPNKITTAPIPSTIDLPKPNEIRPLTPVFDHVVAAMRRAQDELLIVSPYFVPGDDLTQLLIQRQHQGVRVVILTNSLESNDVPVVSGHYQRYRDRLLREGVEIYELRGYPDVLPQPQWRHPIFSIQGSRTALHAKVVVVDGKIGFVGSMNLDPCSVKGNTEVGVLIDQNEFAQQLRQLFLTEIESKYSYRLRQDRSGRTYWYLGAEVSSDEAVALNQPDGVRIRHEPGNWWRKLQKRVGSWLPEFYF